MKKLLGCLLALVCASAAGQMVQVPGYVVVGSSLYSPSPVLPNFITQPTLDTSGAAATDAFVNNTFVRSRGTIPLSNVTGGTYNFAVTGSGLSVVVLTSSGSVSSILSFVNGGTGYAVGDCLELTMGNQDAFIRVTSVSGGVVTGASVLYGGSGYQTGIQAAGVRAPITAQETVTMTGTLTSNATVILENGSYIAGSNQLIMNNNTTGAFTVHVYLSNGAGGTTGNGVILPQGSNNSTAMLIEKDGVNDVWPAVNAFPSGVTCSGSPTASFATSNGIVTHC